MSTTHSLPGPGATPDPTKLWQQAKRFGKGAFYAAIALSIGSSFYRQWKAWKEVITLPPSFYLELDLEQQALVERSSSSPLSMLRAAAGKELELHTLIKVLATAKADGRVRGLFAILGDRGNFGGLAQLQELRNSLLDFRFTAQGRAPVYAYSNAFCEGGANGTGLYYLASAADKVFMPPTGMLALLGFASNQVFIKGLLDKYKVQPEVFRREEYKSALAPLTGTGFDAPQRENLTAVFGSLYDQVVQGIASARRLSPEAVAAAINASPLLASQALQLKLLDGLAYRDQVEAMLLQQLPQDVQQRHQQPLQPPRGVPLAAAYRSKQLSGPRVSLQRYSLADQWAKALQQFWSGGQPGSSSTPPLQQQQVDTAGSASNITAGTAAEGSAGFSAPQGQQGSADSGSSGGSGSSWGRVLPEDRPIVAVVTAAGPIMQSSSGGPEGAQGVVEGHKLVRALRAFRENPQVKAVVLRINSPGGSAVASDMIAREVALLRAAGKPVVASMGDVAASGGYYIAAPCNKILAQPCTITGSIGVIFMKLNMKEALQEYGITGDAITFGENAAWSSALMPLTPKQQQQIDGMIAATYDDFLSSVAKGRSLDKAAVRDVAKGRVWTGSQAMEVGLVDEVGGLLRAVDLAKQLAGLPVAPEATITLEWPPSRVPPIVRALQAAGGFDGTPMEAQHAAASAPAATHSSPLHRHLAAEVTRLKARGAAAVELMAMFWSNALLPAWSNAVPWLQQQPVLPQLSPVCGSLHGQAGQLEVQQQHPALAAAGAAGVDRQLLSLLRYLAQQHSQPEMYCLDAELLSLCC